MYPIPGQTAETCAAKILDEYIGRFGCPLSLHSDQGSNFESDIFRQLCQLMGIRKTRTSVRNQKGNGCIERSHRTLLQMIRAYLKGEQSDWDLHLGCLTSVFRSSESTGLTPNMLVLGREVRTPLELQFGHISEKIVSYGDYVNDLRSRLQMAHDICRRYLAKTAKKFVLSPTNLEIQFGIFMNKGKTVFVQSYSRITSVHVLFSRSSMI